MLSRASDSQLRSDLLTILESQHTVIGTLRQIREQLYPTGIDDPLGLGAVLRAPVHQVRDQYGLYCTLTVSGTVLPVPARVQLEVLRITREALANVVKHARATAVDVVVFYATGPTPELQLTICDNGQTGQPIHPRPKHFGLRSMYEAARTVGGTLAITGTAIGATVRLTVPLASDDAPASARSDQLRSTEIPLAAPPAYVPDDPARARADTVSHARPLAQP